MTRIYRTTNSEYKTKNILKLTNKIKREHIVEKTFKTPISGESALKSSDSKGIIQVDSTIQLENFL
jgi:hypothetical protein